MNDEAIATRARQAFEEEQGLSLRERGFNLHLPTEIALAPLSALTTGEILQGANPGILVPTLLAFSAMGYLSFRLGEANNLDRLIKEGLFDQQDYTRFLDEHIRGNMVPRLMDYFKIEDGLTIHGKSSNVLQTLLSVQILKTSIPYEETDAITRHRSRTENTVKRVLYTERFPEINTATAARWQDEARLTYEQLPEGTRMTEGRWTFPELQDAAHKLGFFFSKMLDYEIANSFDIRLTTTSRDWIERLLFGTRRTRRRIRQYTTMLNLDIYPDIQELASVTQLAIQQLAEEHKLNN